MNNFIIGKTYEARSLCDHNCIFKAEVLKKTAKTVTVKTMDGIVSKKIHVDSEGKQYFYPFGRFSFAPIMREA